MDTTLAEQANIPYSQESTLELPFRSKMCLRSHLHTGMTFPKIKQKYTNKGTLHSPYLD